MIKNITITLLLVMAGPLLIAQPAKIPFEKFSVAEGLPEEVAVTPLQDDKGFIWFGTQNGLVKYDGYHFKVFRQISDKTDTTGLDIRSSWGGLLKGKDGKIWIGESGGQGAVSSFDPLTEKFRNYYPTGRTGQGTDQNQSLLLFEDEAGNIWFKNGSFLTGKLIICRLNPVTGVIKKYPTEEINGRNRYLRNFGTIEAAGTIWLVDNKKNLNRLNRQKDSFEIIIPAGKDFLQSGIADTVRQLSKGSAGRLLLTGSHGLYIFDTKDGNIIKSYVHQPGNPYGIADSAFYATEDFKGQIWVIHRQGKISLIDPFTNNIQIFTYGSGPIPYQNGIKTVEFFLVLTQNKEGIMFQARAGGSTFQRPTFLLHYHFAIRAFSFYDYNFNLRNNPLPPKPVGPYTSLEDRTGLLWLGTRPGLYKQAPKKQQLDLFRHRMGEPGGLPSDTVRYLFEDSKKRLWVGTSNGLAVYQPGLDNFRVLSHEPANSSSLSDSRIEMIQEDADGKIWVGTQNGLNQWQESTGRFKRFFYSPGDAATIQFIFPDKQQRLWVSILNKGVFVLEKSTGRLLKKYFRDDKNPASLTGNDIKVFYQDSRGTIWLGDYADNQFGLYRLHEKEDGFRHYLPIPGDSSSISSDEIHFLTEDAKKRLWIGTDGGLNEFDYAGDRFVRYYNGKGSLMSISGYVIDKKGNAWFATYSGEGLVAVDAEKRKFTAYGESKGLLQNDISGAIIRAEITKDELGRFWLPTQRGLSVFNPETQSFISYFEKDGFQPYDRRYVSVKTSNGDIWIGSNNGLNRIVPANLLKKDTTPPTVVLTQVTINDSLFSKPDGTIFKQSVSYTNAIELKHWQKDISFDFVALHYLRSEDNLYSWKLENYDKDWSAPSRERKASYTNLSPGKYIFRVKASNADGVWNEEGISFTITILPPWWKTWWAYLLYVLVIGSGIGAFIRYRSKALVREKEMLEQKVEQRTRQLRESIENLKSTQAQLVQSEKMASLGELTAGIAHEIQNPLNFVNNFSELNTELIDELKQELATGNLQSAKELADNIRENEEKIAHHGKRADGIVKGMLQHSRSSSGQKEPTDINALCDEYLRLAYHGLRAKDKSFNAKFETQLDPNVGMVSVLPQEMGRVILNLINNAFYAVTERKKQAGPGYEPSVMVSTRKDGGKVEIRIRDNGTGIPQKVIDKIFQPFFTTKPTGEGTGLGLSLSYDIITKGHGGEMKVETREGEGTSFFVLLPF